MNIQPVLDFYHKKISVDKFMTCLNSDTEMQTQFNKVLRYIPANWKTETAMGWINSCYENKSFYVIWLYARDFLVKSENIKYVTRKEIDEMILDEVTSMPAFYSADKTVEKYILKNFISPIKEITSYSKTLKEVKEKVKTVFLCEKRMPSWAQYCEWPIYKGTPMLFIKQTQSGEKVTYIFKDTQKNKITEIVQYY